MGSRSGIKSYRVSFNFYITPGVKLLLVANFAVFIFEALLYYFSGRPAYEGLVKWFGLVPAGVVPLFRIWQPFTYLFLHDISTIWHILMNMFMLWMFGRELELVWGRNRFLRYYFLTGVGAGLLNVIVNTVPMLWGRENSYVPTIGASCAIFFPDRRAYIIPIPIPIKMKWIVAGMAAITFLGTFGLGDDKVSHICH